jgi:hypothetical protein
VIEVLLSTGDRAEAEDPESAQVAARTMMDDAESAGAASRFLTASFYVDGKLVRDKVRRSELGSI